MTDDFSKLAEALTGIVDILNKYEEKCFVDDIGDAIELCVQEKRQGATRYLELCGGMGSLTDMFICPENNCVIRLDEVRDVNQKLRTFRSNAYVLSIPIRAPVRCP